MLKSKLLATGVAAVLTFGLIACSSDKKSKSDTWDVDAPKIAIKAGAHVGFTDEKAAPETIAKEWSPNLREMSHRVLPEDAQIVFESLAQSGAPFKLIVSTDCSFGALHAHEQKTFAQASSFSLRSILPRELLVTALSNATYYSCSANLIVQNEIGSTINFALPKLFIENLDRVSDVALEAFDTHQKIDTTVPGVAYADAHRYVLAQAPKQEPSSVSLVCDHSVKTKNYSDLAEFHVNDLTALDATSPKWRQTCRVVVSPIDHPELVHLTARFVLQREVPSIKIEASPINCGEFLSPTAMSFAITNTSAQPQIVGLHIPRRVHASSGILHMPDVLEPSLLDSAMQTEVMSTETMTDANNIIWMTIVAGESKSVQVTTGEAFNNHACPGSGGLLNYQFVDRNEPWQPNGDFSRTWPEGDLPSLVQSGHYESLSEIVADGAGVGDVQQNIPFAMSPSPLAKGLQTFGDGSLRSAY